MPAKREANWVMTRLHKDVHKRLTAMLARLKTAVPEMPERFPPWMLTDDISLSAVVRLLIYREDTLNQRRKASRATAVAKRKTKG